MADDYTQVALDFILKLHKMRRDLELLGFRDPITEIRVEPRLGLAMGIPPGTAAVFDGVVVHADAEIARR